jgi:hypothetical protein
VVTPGAGHLTVLCWCRATIFACGFCFSTCITYTCTGSHNVSTYSRTRTTTCAINDNATNFPLSVWPLGNLLIKNHIIKPPAKSDLITSF